MVKTHKKFTKFSRPSGKRTNEIIGVRLNSHTPNVAEVGEKSNALDEENIAKKIAGQCQPKPHRLDGEKGQSFK